MTPASEAPERDASEGIWRHCREEGGVVSSSWWKRGDSGVVGEDVPGWGGRPEVQKQQEEGSAQGGKAPRVSHATGGQATEGCAVSCPEGFGGPLSGC